MVSPFFLASRRDYVCIAAGTAVALAESVGDPVATILVGRIFRELQQMLLGRLAAPEFVAHVRGYCVGLVAVAAYTLLTNWVGYIVWVGLGYRQGHAARRALFGGIVLRSAAWYDCRAQISGLAVMSFKDVQDLETAAGIAAYEIAAMAAGFCIQIGVAFYYSWAVTLVCLAGIPVLVLIGAVLSPRVTQRVLVTKSLLDEISQRIAWALGALQTVKVFQRERFEWACAHRRLAAYERATVAYWRLFRLQEGLCRSVVLMIFVQGFYFGAFMVQRHGLDAGNVVTVFFACLAASGLLQQLVGHILEWNKGVASAERLHDVLHFETADERLYNSIGLMPGTEGAAAARLERLGWALETSSVATRHDSMPKIPLQRVNSLDSGLSLDSVTTCPTGAAPAPAPARAVGHAVFSNVVFSYPARQEIVLAGLSMEFAPGSLTFVVGSSGSGKSTIAALLSKQYPWQAGEVSIDGHGVDLLSKHWIERNVYVVEQMPKLFDISLLDNIRIGSRSPTCVTTAQVERACETCCADFVWRLPQGLDTSGSYALSGGQIQRISLCRALISDAPIMVFDEATSALEPQLQTEVMRRVTAYRRDKTTIVITHDASFIPEGFPVYVVNDGVAERFRTVSAAVPGVLKSPAFAARRASYGATPDMRAAAEKPVEGKVATARLSARKGAAGTARNGAAGKAAVGTSVALFKSLPSKGLFCIGMAITTIHAAINPVFSFVFSKLIMGILDPAASRVTLWAMLVLTCAVLDGIVTFCSVVLNAVGERWLTSVRERLFSQLLDHKGMSFSRKQASDLAKLLMSDAEKCAAVLTVYWPGLLSMLVLGLVGCIWSLATGWKLTLVAVALVPAFLAMNQLYKWLSTRWTAKRELLRADVMRLLSDLTSPAGFRTLKLQHLERFFQRFYDQRESDLHALTPKMVFQIGFGYGTLKSFPYMLESLVLWYGMYLTAHNQYSAQTTMTVFSLVMFTIVTIDQLTSSIGSVGTGFEAVQRLMRVLAETRPSKSKLAGPRPFLIAQRKTPEWTSIGFHRVEVSSPTREPILSALSLEFRQGETVAIVGPSGVGKSTVARLLLKLQRPSRGEIVIDKQWDLEALTEFDVRQSVAMVGQMPLDFFEGTIEENLLYALDTNDISGPAKMVDVCKLCGVHDFVTDLRDAYNTHMKNGLLSGGQMQRLGIARAVLRMPKVLILDECTSALDQQSKHLIMSLIQTLKQSRDMIIIMITHEMDVAAIADRTILLSAH